MKGTTYKQRREGTKGSASHSTRLVRAAHQASVNPKGMQKAMGLQDAALAKKARARKALLLKALAEKGRRA